MKPYIDEKPKRLTRDERVQKIAQVIREWEEARHLWDDMTRVKFTVCIKAAPDELAEAKGIIYGERVDGNH